MADYRCHRDQEYGGRGDRDSIDRAGDEAAAWFSDKKARGRRDREDHRGRGPRPYRCSDERILEDVNDRLIVDRHSYASNIEVSVAGCEVMLGRTVTGRFANLNAEDLAEIKPGVTRGQNNLRIARPLHKRNLQGRADLSGCLAAAYAGGEQNLPVSRSI